MMKTVLVIFSAIIFFCSNGKTQDIDYGTFKGKPVDVVVDISIKKMKVKIYDKKVVTEQEEKLRRTRENVNPEADYAGWLGMLLSKLYHAKSADELVFWLEDKSLMERFEVKKVKDYKLNHFIFKYEVKYDYGEGRIGVIKYGEINDGIEIGEYTLQARRGTVGRGYKVTDIPELESLEYIMKSLSAAAFLEFYRTYDSPYDYINELRTQVRSESNKLNFDKLGEVLHEIEKNDQTLYNKLRTMKAE